MAHQFADVLVKALEQIDDWLAEQRDRRRFRMRDMQPRTLQTLFGVDLTFRRRRYLEWCTCWTKCCNCRPKSS